MGRRPSPGESDIAQLKKKIAKQAKTSDKSDADPALRSLRKRLKRAQRKQRALALRKVHASGKKADAKAAAAAS